MKKLSLISIIFACVFIFNLAHADLTLQADGKNPKIKRFEVLNIKTGGSGMVTCNGEICTLDETNLTGINWQSLNSLGVAGVNWTGAAIAYNGINWTDMKVGTISRGSSSGVNWTDFRV